jgi:outer membrane lipoprotein-sorting protein
MLLKSFLLLLSLGFLRFLSADPGGKEILKMMHDRYAGKWYRTLTFNQKTEMYRNDSLQQTQTWYEALIFPDKFRIDFGPSDSGNSVIYKGDSVFIFRNRELRARRKDANDLTFLLGGMYFYRFDQAVSKMKELGFDLNQSHEDIWKGRPVYVIGAGKGNDTSNQLWIDKENLYLVRMLTLTETRKEEGLFENHIKLGGGWTETRVVFYINGKLVQVETYHDCKANPELDPAIFEPDKLRNWK